MSVSLLEVLGTPAAAKPAEAAAKGSDAPREFGPTLAQAYEAERPKATAPGPKETSAEGAHTAPEHDESSAPPADEEAAAPEIEEEEADGSEEEEGDAVAISAEAAAAAGPETVAKELIEKLVEELAEAGAGEAEATQDPADKSAPSAEAAAEAEKQQKATAAKAGPKSAVPLFESGDPVDQAGADTAKQEGLATRAEAPTGKTAEAVSIETAEQRSERSAEQIAEAAVDNAPPAENDQGGDRTAAASKDERPAAVVSSEKPPADAAAAVAARAEPSLDATGRAETGGTAAAEPATAAAPASSAADGSKSLLDRLARSVHSSEGRQPADGEPHIDRARFVQRVEGALRTAQQRDGRVQVRLSPPELGNLRIELAVQNGVMSAKLEAETPAARNALLDNLPALRERLAQQDVRIEKFDVDVRRDGTGAGGSGGMFDRQDRHADQSEGERQSARLRHAARSAAAASGAGSPVANNASIASGLDVRV